MELTLSLMTQDDIDGVLEVSSLSLKESWSKKAYLDELKNPVAKYIIAKKSNKVVGFLGVWSIIDEGHITNIAVHPEYRHQHIGSELITYLIEHSPSWGIDSLTLEVRTSNIIAQSLYKKYNFYEEGIRKAYYNDNKEDAIIMWRKN